MAKNSLCMVLSDLVKKENESIKLYEELESKLIKEEKLTGKLMNTLKVFSSRHRSHAATLKEIISDVGCESYEKPLDVLLEPEQYELPLSERTRRAREFLKRM